DLVRIWQKERTTILFITHDIDEAVQLADRVVVMSHRPATIQTVVGIPSPRPRDLESADYLLARDRIFTAMGMNPHSGGEIIEQAADRTSPPGPRIRHPFTGREASGDQAPGRRLGWPGACPPGWARRAGRHAMPSPAPGLTAPGSSAPQPSGPAVARQMQIVLRLTATIRSAFSTALSLVAMDGASV